MTVPAEPLLVARGVDVHLVDLSADADEVAAAASVLSPGELARAERGTPEVRRRRVLLRAALRRAVAAELGTEPARVVLSTAPGGRPVVPAAGVDVNCSASGSLGLVALARGRRVGVDVERLAPWSPEVLDEGWLHPDEQAALLRLPAPARAAATTRAWTRKEAALKARGTGLRGNLRATVTPVGAASGRVAGWDLHDVPVPAGWVASLAVGPLEEP
ncbi:4'-phosphopantetheinyl transferase family protein [Trujillonella humicola]|uniref:4'-phosphopantetheinyl transferase family protein n=1 Tax=Trujillonella humicola TaxID=3383699 RepID=UPI003905AC0D